MYDVAVRRLRELAGEAGGVGAELTVFGDGMDASRWGAGVVGALRGAGAGALRVGLLYDALAEQMGLEGDRGAAAREAVPWAPEMEALEGAGVAGDRTEAGPAVSGAARRPSEAGGPVDLGAEVQERLAAVESRADAQQYIAELGLSKKDLLSLAGRLDVYVTSTMNKATVQARIVEAKVGARLDHAAILGGSWRSP